jgi:VWFA-related protein
VREARVALLGGLIDRHALSVGVAVAAIALTSGRVVVSVGAQQAPVFRSSTQAEWLIATAIAKDGRLVTDLSRDEFEVRDRGTVRDVTAFRSDPIPFALAIMLDVSGSMIMNLPTERRALSALTGQFAPGDRAAVGTFESVATLSPRFSANPDTLAGWITATIGGAAVPCLDPVPVPQAWRGAPRPVSKGTVPSSTTIQLLQPKAPGSTALWDALECAVDAVASDAETPRRVVLVITDGIDNQSVATEEDVRDFANHYDVMVYCIGMFGTDLINADVLRGLATSTGGGYFQLTAGDDLAPTFALP